MVSIDVRVGESIEQALRRFNREVLKAGILLELRRREFRMKPSEVRKQKKEQKERKIHLANNPPVIQVEKKPRKGRF